MQQTDSGRDAGWPARTPPNVPGSRRHSANRHGGRSSVPHRRPSGHSPSSTISPCWVRRCGRASPTVIQTVQWIVMAGRFSHRHQPVFRPSRRPPLARPSKADSVSDLRERRSIGWVEGHASAMLRAHTILEVHSVTGSQIDVIGSPASALRANGIASFNDASTDCT